jgi:Glycosyl hydrolase family 99
MRGSRRLHSWLCALLALAALPVAISERPAAAATALPFPSGPVAPTRADAGTWLAASDGGVFAFGGAPFYGSMGGRRLNKPIVTMAAAPSGKGYWLVASDGGVFAFGDAAFHGSTGGITLQKPIVAMAPTPSGKGYWLVASDGGVFAFGDARFFGSTGGRKLVKPIVGMTATATGEGYWLVASDGGIFSFGDAKFLGGTGGTKLKAPIVGMAATPGGRGYWLAAADGGIFTFGDASFAGSAGGLRLAGPVVSMATTLRGLGYWLVGSDGGIFSFGDAGFAGSLGGIRLAAPIVALAPRPATIPAEVSIFFYPWYSKPGVDLRAGWRHWEQNNHQPQSGDIGANFFPADGLYSSLDPKQLAKQARQMAASGVDTVVTSWWGRGAFEDWMLPDLVTAVRAAGLRLAIHFEPYKNRSFATVTADLAYFRSLGISDVYIYQADGWGPAADWTPALASQPDMRFFAESGNRSSMQSGSFADYARTAGFDGIYTYDGMNYGAAELAVICGAARQRRLLCSPSVAPGVDARRAGFPHWGVVPPANGERYDYLWRSALAAGADVVSITSWNEWHEGTQIEPAKPYCFPSDGYCSPGYEGAYGRTGPAAQTAYMDRTAEWARDFRSLRAPG